MSFITPGFCHRASNQGVCLNHCLALPFEETDFRIMWDSIAAIFLTERMDLIPSRLVHAGWNTFQKAPCKQCQTLLQMEVFTQLVSNIKRICIHVCVASTFACKFVSASCVNWALGFEFFFFSPSPIFAYWSILTKELVTRQHAFLFVSPVLCRLSAGTVQHLRPVCTKTKSCGIT